MDQEGIGIVLHDLDGVALAEAAKKASEPGRLRKNLESAHALYRGDFLVGSYDDWAEEQRVFYREQFLRVLNGGLIAERQS